MGRKSAIFGFWLLGFTLGFGGYLASPSVGSWLMEILPQLFVSETFVGAFIAGLATSIITMVSVFLWAKTTRP